MTNPKLHTRSTMRRTWFNRVFALAYTCPILALLHHHTLDLLHSTTLTSLLILISDTILAFMWISYQSFRINPIRREVFIENLSHVVKDEREYPGLDVFICTADPLKEPPIGVVNTALSALAFDYPTDKLAVYVSDDGGSDLTLFAFMEAAKFAKYWLPFCKKNGIVDRCPEAYFGGEPAKLPETDDIKVMHEIMKMRVEQAVEKGKVCDDVIDDHARQAFSKWTENFTRHHHPAVIQVLLDSEIDKDTTGHGMPKLVYVSREKGKDVPHNFKAGALNVLLRVSAIMTNAPIILTLDCDMYSNDPTTPLRALCYYLDPSMDSTLGWIQFPQLFKGINKTDIYGSELKFEVQINPAGFDGLKGPSFMGTGCFFRRRVFSGAPFSDEPAEITQLNPQSEDVLAQAHRLASCRYEAQTKWGSEVGFRYDSLVEDIYTSYRLHCLGWRSVFCNPKRGAFLGDVPTNLHDSLTQMKRWCMGLLDIFFSNYCPLTYGIRHTNIFQCLAYTHYTLWLILSIPITIYSFLPQLALINSFPMFPKVSESWFLLYVFLFLGPNVQNLFEFMVAGGTFVRWWNNQRMGIIRGLSSFPFALLEYVLKSVGMSSFGYNVTSKVVDNEENKHYEQGIFEFGVPSPMFLPLAMAAIINLFSFSSGVLRVLKNGRLDDVFVQIFISAYLVVSCWPVYEAMVLRSDKGKMPGSKCLLAFSFIWYVSGAFFERERKVKYRAASSASKMRSVGASQQVPTRSRNYRRRSREIVDNARRYFSPKKSEGSSSSRFKNRGRTSRTKLNMCSSHGILDCASNGNVSLIEDDDVPIPPWTFLILDQDGDPMTINIPSDVNMNNMQIPEHVRFVSVEKVSTLLRMIVGLQNILVSKMLESRDRLNASNVVIHELRRRIQEYEGNQNRNGDEEDGLVTSEVVPGAGGGR
ncbi:hypothetical protein LguiA_015806 [Lonicera macranthoides]